MRISVLSIPLLAASPVIAFAADYLTVEQAGKLMFPDAERFELRSIAPSVVPRQPGVVQVRAALRGSSTLGYVLSDEVIGKFERIGYAVGVGADGAVKQVEILSYRESHGHEVRLPAWRKQFVGKTSNSPLQVGEDIANISGATLSCKHVTDGVKRLVTLLEQVRRSGVL